VTGPSSCARARRSRARASPVYSRRACDPWRGSSSGIRGIFTVTRTSIDQQGLPHRHRQVGNELRTPPSTAQLSCGSQDWQGSTSVRSPSASHLTARAGVVRLAHEISSSSGSAAMADHFLPSILSETMRASLATASQREDGPLVRLPAEAGAPFTGFRSRAPLAATMSPLLDALTRHRVGGRFCLVTRHLSTLLRV